MNSERTSVEHSDFDGLDLLAEEAPVPDALDLTTIEKPNPVNRKVVASNLSCTKRDVRREIASRDDNPVTNAREINFVSSADAAVTKDDEISVYGRVAFCPADLFDSENTEIGEEPTETVRLVDKSGAVDVVIDSRMDLPRFETGDELLVTGLKSMESDRKPLKVTNDSDVFKVSTLDAEFNAGTFMERRSGLVNADDWFENMTDQEAVATVVDTLLEEEEIETPENQGDDENVFFYVSDSESPDFGVWKDNGDEIINEMLEKHLPRGKRARRIKREVVNSVMDRTRVPEGTWERGEHEEEHVKWSVPCENGVIDLRDGTLQPHAAKWRARSKLPVSFDDDLDSLGDEVDEFLDDVTDCSEDRELLLEIAGHAITRTYPARRVFALVGPGRNGKTVWMDVLRALLGDENVGDVSLSSVAGDDSKGGKGVIGNHLAVDDDATGTKIKDVSVLKKLSGGAQATLDIKYLQCEGYNNYATVCFAANNPPSIEDKSDAAKERLTPIRLPHRFTNKSDGHKDAVNRSKLVKSLTRRGELKRLLAVAVERAQQQYETGEITSGRDEDERWEIYNKYSDTTYRFWSECMESDTGSKISKKAVYETYVQRCESEGIDPQPQRGPTSFWSISRQSAGISFDDDARLGDKTAVKHVNFSPDAVDHMPDWVADEWADEADDSENHIVNNVQRSVGIGELSKTGYQTTEGTVISRVDDDYVELVITDGDATIDVIEETNGSARLDGVDVGDEIKLTQCKLIHHPDTHVPVIKVARITDVEILTGDSDSDDVDVDDVDDSDAVDVLRDAVSDSSRHSMTRETAANVLQNRDVVGSYMEGTAVVSELLDSGDVREVGGEDSVEITVIDGGGE